MSKRYLDVCRVASKRDIDVCGKIIIFGLSKRGSSTCSQMVLYRKIKALRGIVKGEIAADMVIHTENCHTENWCGYSV